MTVEINLIGLESIIELFQRIFVRLERIERVLNLPEIDPPEPEQDE